MMVEPPQALRAVCRPPWQQKAVMARWLVHQSDWGVLSAITPTGLPLGWVATWGWFRPCQRRLLCM
jgi:hypothetical protein